MQHPVKYTTLSANTKSEGQLVLHEGQVYEVCRESPFNFEIQIPKWSILIKSVSSQVTCKCVLPEDVQPLIEQPESKNRKPENKLSTRIINFFKKIFKS